MAKRLFIHILWTEDGNMRWVDNQTVGFAYVWNDTYKYAPDNNNYFADLLPDELLDELLTHPPPCVFSVDTTSYKLAKVWDIPSMEEALGGDSEGEDDEEGSPSAQNSDEEEAEEEAAA